MEFPAGITWAPGHRESEPSARQYRNPERIARGGMGEIYRAEDADLGRIVAIKVLADRYAGDAAVRARFTREALAAARLSNAPSTVTIFDVGEHDGHPYIVMEYLSGGSLADRLAADGAQPIGRSLDWLGQAAAALDAAHASGVVHRDVKPANLLLDNDDRVKVADFGIASAVGLGSLTEAGTVLGTAGYLAPEQARGEKATPASDRYALAVVAFELLTGARPFERDPPPPRRWHMSASRSRPPQASTPSCRHRSTRPSPAVWPRSPSTGTTRLPTSSTRYATPSPTPPARRPSGRSPRSHEAAAPLVGPSDRGRRPAARRHSRRSAAGARSARTSGEDRAENGEGNDHPSRDDGRPDSDDPKPAAPTTTAATPSGSPSELNDQGFELMGQGDFQGALPLLEQAVAGLSGSGETAEAYASYNLALTRLALGSCEGVIELLDRSEEIQGKRKEITRARHDAEKSCEGER